MAAATRVGFCTLEPNSAPCFCHRYFLMFKILYNLIAVGEVRADAAAPRLRPEPALPLRPAPPVELLTVCPSALCTTPDQGPERPRRAGCRARHAEHKQGQERGQEEGVGERCRAAPRCCVRGMRAGLPAPRWASSLLPAIGGLPASLSLSASGKTLVDVLLNEWILLSRVWGGHKGGHGSIWCAANL